MIKVQLPVVVALALVLGGCAQPPLGNSKALAAEAAHYRVSRQLLLSAESAGYSPKTRRGETLFCAQQESFSYIPRTHCLDPAQMKGRLQEEATFRRSVRNRVMSVPRTPGGSGPPF